MPDLRAPEARAGDYVRAVPDDRDCDPVEGPLELFVNSVSVVPMVQGSIVDPTTIEVLETGPRRSRSDHPRTLGEAAAEGRLYRPRGAAGRSWSELWDPMEKCVHVLLTGGWSEVERFADSSEGIDAVTMILREGQRELELEVDDLLTLRCWSRDADGEEDEDVDGGPTEPDVQVKLADATWVQEFARRDWI